MAEVIAEVRAGIAGRPDRPERTRSWWRRPRGFALSPVAGLALAAGFAGVVVLVRDALRPAAGGRVAAAVDPVPPSAAPAEVARGARAPDTVHVVRFVLVDRSARGVTLVGDFNGWDRAATRLVRAAAGRPGDPAVWTVTVALPPGRHEYAFVVDGRRWVTDSAAPVVEDEFGTRSSVVTLDAPTRPTVGRSAVTGPPPHAAPAA
jgi:hypothetical protein